MGRCQELHGLPFVPMRVAFNPIDKHLQTSRWPGTGNSRIQVQENGGGNERYRGLCQARFRRFRLTLWSISR
jgi:hypothetical protein